MERRLYFEIAFFDFDGVILESEQTKNETMLNFFRRFPERASSEIISYHKKFKSKSRYEKLDYLFNNIMPNHFAHKKQRELANDLNEALFSAVCASPEVNGSRHLLGKLKRVIPIVLVSATPFEELEKVLQIRSMRQYFVDVFGTPPLKHIAIQQVLNDRSIHPSNAFLVGDSISDQTAADKAGVRFFGRRSSPGTTFSENCVLVVNDLTELEKKLVVSKDRVFFR